MDWTTSMDLKKILFLLFVIFLDFLYQMNTREIIFRTPDTRYDTVTVNISSRKWWYSLLRWQYIDHNNNTENRSDRFWVVEEEYRKKTEKLDGFLSVCALLSLMWFLRLYFSSFALSASNTQELFSMYSCRVPTVSAAVVQTHHWL